MDPCFSPKYLAKSSSLAALDLPMLNNHSKHLIRPPPAIYSSLVLHCRHDPHKAVSVSLLQVRGLGAKFSETDSLHLPALSSKPHLAADQLQQLVVCKMHYGNETVEGEQGISSRRGCLEEAG